MAVVHIITRGAIVVSTDSSNLVRRVEISFLGGGRCTSKLDLCHKACLLQAYLYILYIYYILI